VLIRVNTVIEVKEEYDSDPYFMVEVTLIDTLETGKGCEQPAYSKLKN